MYQFQYTLAPVSKDSIWEQFTTTKHKATIEGLEKDRYYDFRVAGAPTYPSRNYTDWIVKWWFNDVDEKMGTRIWRIKRMNAD